MPKICDETLHHGTNIGTKWRPVSLAGAAADNDDADDTDDADDADIADAGSTYTTSAATFTVLTTSGRTTAPRPTFLPIIYCLERDVLWAS